MYRFNAEFFLFEARGILGNQQIDLRRKQRVALGLVIAVTLTLLQSCIATPSSAVMPSPSPGDSALFHDSPAGVTLAFVGVNVIAMDGATARSSQTVIVRNGVISEMGDARTVSVPAGAYVVPGATERYLLPGLTDMHVHMFDRDEMLLYLANGVTTVRNMHGLTRHLAWRDSIARGQLLGPHIVTAGPILDGDPPTRSTNVVVRTPEEARQIVKQQIESGFDFIKIYDNISPQVYAAINDEARKLGRQVVGHVPSPVGLSDAISGSGQHGIEHTEELLPFFNDGRASSGSAIAPVTLFADSLRRVAQRIAAAGVFVDPTAGVYESALAQSRGWTAVNARAEMAYVNPETRRTWGWDETGTSRSGVTAAIQRFDRTRNFMVQQMIPAFKAAGVRLLAGSDAPIPALVPGFALLDELDLFREAGLTPFQVLETAISNPARFLNQPNRGGELMVGREADLLLVDGNPLVDLGALRRRLGIVVHGQWLNQPGLKRRIDSLATRYRQQ